MPPKSELFILYFVRLSREKTKSTVAQFVRLCQRKATSPALALDSQSIFSGHFLLFLRHAVHIIRRRFFSGRGIEIGSVPFRIECGLLNGARFKRPRHRELLRISRDGKEKQGRAK